MKALQTTIHFNGLSWVLTRPAYTIVALLVLLLGGLGAWQLGSGVVVVMLVGLVLFIVPTRIRIGPDGVTLRWLWLRRHIPYEQIEDVACYDEIQMGRWREIGLRIHMPSGVLHLPMRHHDRLAFWVRDPRRDAEMALTWLSFHRDAAPPRLSSPR